MQNQNRHGRYDVQNGGRGGRDNLRGRRSSYKPGQSVWQCARDLYADKTDGIGRRQSDAICRCAYSWELSIANPTTPNKNMLNATRTRMMACPLSGLRLISASKM